MIIKLIWKMLLDTKRVEFQVRYYINFDFNRNTAGTFLSLSCQFFPV